jgi:hypothetical protein
MDCFFILRALAHFRLSRATIWNVMQTLERWAVTIFSADCVTTNHGFVQMD